MAQRNVTITLRDKQTTGGLIPGDAVFGEPFVNLYDGVLKFSGVTGGSYETTPQAGVFEVGSTLYNQYISNRLNINGNFIISGDTGLISTYNGISGAGLSGKFLSGTTNGLVLANISDIAAAASGNEGDVQYKSGTGFGAEGVFNYNSSTDTLIVPNFSAVTFSASSNIYSAGTSLETIIYNIAASTEDVTRVQPGTNITTGGTANNPTINLIDSPSVNNITYSGTSTGGNSIATNVSATTNFYSAGTSLETIIYNIAASTENITSVQPGSNITTGGTASSPIISVVGSPSFNNITYSGTSTGGNSIATNVSATTNFYSAGTSLETIIYNIAASTEDVTRVQPGTNITTGGTANNPTINLVDSPSVNGFTASGTANFTGALQSGGTDLYSIFVGSVTAGSNITIGGTAQNPTVGVVSSPSFAGSVTATGVTVSGLLAGSVVYAGAGGELKTESGFAYNDATDTFSTKYITVGVPGQTGTTAVIHGDVQVIGASISAFTSQLYIEDNLIELNYNPTASTDSTSLGAGWSIQDGSGVAGTDVLWDIRGTATGLDNRSFATNLQDIRIRETGTISSPNGVRVIAEYDILDGGSY